MAARTLRTGHARRPLGRHGWLCPGLGWILLVALVAPPSRAASPSSSASAPSAASAASSARPVEWGYTGALGPEHWARLSPAYSACAASESQSPIALAGADPVASMPVRMDYHESVLRIAHHEHVEDLLDNGHTLQVTLDEGSRLETERDRYALKQFHFHAPAEHAIDGRLLPLEVHFVHQSDGGRFAVVAAFYDEGEADPDLARLIEHLPAAPGERVHRPGVSIHPARHLPREIAAWRYLGSFTTPPCTPDVEWLVMRSPQTASRGQLEALASRLHTNARPLQPRASRPVTQSRFARDLVPGVAATAAPR